MIQIQPSVLDACSNQLRALAANSVTISESLSGSIGKTADAVREYFELLNQLASKDLPELFNNSALLLQAIKTEFERADEEIAGSY